MLFYKKNTLNASWLRNIDMRHRYYCNVYFYYNYLDRFANFFSRQLRKDYMAGFGLVPTEETNVYIDTPSLLGLF